MVRLLEQGAERDAKDLDGHTPLHVAAWYGCETTVLLLLDRGAFVDLKDVHGQGPLHLAALGGHDSVVRVLLARGADREAKDVHGHVPLHHAALAGKDSTVQLLLARGVGSEANVTRQIRRSRCVGARGSRALIQPRLEREIIKHSEVYGGKHHHKRFNCHKETRGRQRRMGVLRGAIAEVVEQARESDLAIQGSLVKSFGFYSGLRLMYLLHSDKFVGLTG